MSEPIIKLIKINGLQYNAQRDPQVYRRSVGRPFRIDVMLRGAGEARCSLADAQARPIAEKTVSLPGTFTAEVAYDSAGSRIVTFACEAGGKREAQDLRLDVLEHDWVG